jgi:DNA-binding IclR family transcriptional regulator
LSVRGHKPPVGEPVLDRAFRLLAAFGPADRSLSLTAMSARAGMPKSSALRIARQLVDCGALERQGDADFVIGLRLLEIASLAPRGHGLRQTALPYMEDLHVATRQHVLLAVRDGGQAVLVERLSARGAGPVLYRVGGRMPLHATGVGLCLLANAGSDVQDQALAGDLTMVPENRRLSPSELRATLAAVRRTGVAVASRPNPSPMTSVAAPIFGCGNEVIAALSVVTPSADVDPIALTPAVTAVCRSISRAMRRD